MNYKRPQISLTLLIFMPGFNTNGYVIFEDRTPFCVFGGIGRLVCAKLKADNIDFVVIEKSQTDIEQAEDMIFNCMLNQILDKDDVMVVLGKKED